MTFSFSTIYTYLWLACRHSLVLFKWLSSKQESKLQDIYMLPLHTYYTFIWWRCITTIIIHEDSWPARKTAGTSSEQTFDDICVRYWKGACIRGEDIFILNHFSGPKFWFEVLIFWNSFFFELAKWSPMRKWTKSKLVDLDGNSNSVIDDFVILNYLWF